MNWKNLLKEVRDSIELVEEMEEFVREFETYVIEIKSYADMERKMAVKKDFGIPYEEVLSELKEAAKSGMLKDNVLIRLFLEELRVA